MNKALLVLDMQKDYIGEHAKMSVAKQQITPLLNSVNKVISECENVGFSVIYIRNEFEAKQIIRNFLRKQTGIKGSNGAELDDRLLMVGDTYFSKNIADAMSNRKLIEFIEMKGITDLWIVGVFAEGCIMATVKEALRKKYTVTVIEDGIASASDQKRLASIQKLRLMGVELVHSSNLVT
ncbi:isochorismatase family cysteine hydrolase [Bacillus massiliigorillae]|uniref:isochorismatase family cysteine hydrolase n=1 Tax=Bacillus massiliigorillae TaxID=1243664 RepID=UPI0003A301C7|nr:isochorismatase family cysteine hydrolase [Bacillus massiliigorillae]